MAFANTYDYSPLEGSEIRLLRFETSSEEDGQLRLRLDHYDIRRRPLYIALSYVWGVASNHRAVLMNNHTFPVTNNLHDALRHIRDLSPYLGAGVSRAAQSSQVPPLFWIDALSINQRDLDEKSKQVPRMTEIYSQAFTVVTWLGTIEDLRPPPRAFDLLLSILQRMLPVSDFERPPFEIEAHGTAANPEDIALDHLKIYGRIVMNDWFSRVWVVQEYSLSKRQPIALIGYAMFSLQALHSFALRLDQLADHADPAVRNKLGHAARLVQSMARRSFGWTYMPDYFRSPAFVAKTTAQKLLWIVTNLGTKYSSVPHDQIYGILGMVDVSDLPAHLFPDYRLPYADVCRMYTRYLIEDNMDLRLLMFSTPACFEHQPSWVVEFRNVSPWMLEPYVAQAGRFTEDGAGLVVEGVKVGLLRQVLPQQFVELDQQVVRIQHFHDTILSAAARIRQVPLREVWREWFADHLQFTCSQTRAAVTAAARFTTADEFLQSVTANIEDRSDGIERRFVVSAFGGHSFALLEDGTVTRCGIRPLSEDAAVQHEVWAFKGAVQRYIVSRDGHDRRRYVGWLTEAGGRDLDEEFFADHMVEQITLT